MAPGRIVQPWMVFDLINSSTVNRIVPRFFKHKIDSSTSKITSRTRLNSDFDNRGVPTLNFPQLIILYKLYSLTLHCSMMPRCFVSSVSATPRLFLKTHRRIFNRKGTGNQIKLMIRLFRIFFGLSLMRGESVFSSGKKSC
jgi:hypothetical protein